MSPLDVPLALLALAFALALVRLASAPTVADRVIAAEFAFAVLLGALGLLGARLRAPEVVTVGMVVALLQFVSTAALARLVHRTGEDEP